MILVDTSVWIDHFRNGDPSLVEMLAAGTVLTHPFVIGELACGNLKDREKVLEFFLLLPPAPLAQDAEVHQLLRDRKLWGKGLGWVDLHLLASAKLGDAMLWTKDARLTEAASRTSVPMP